MTKQTDALLAARSALDYIQGWVDYRVWRTRVPGVQVAVWFGGELRLSKAFGVADATTQERLTTTHQFRIASHSKMFTATAILGLAERGLLGLDDRASAYVPVLASSAAAQVTIRELLSHAAGVTRDSEDSTFWSLSKPFPDHAQLTAILSEAIDVLPSSTAFKYTNIGYGVLGLIIEAVSGQSFEDHMREHVIRPLGLTRTVPDLDVRKSAKYAASHSGLHTSMTRKLYENPSSEALAAATGFTSTAAETVRFAAAHFLGSGELLSDQSKRWMAQQLWSTKGRDGTESGYGLGLMSRPIAGRTWLGHGGGWPGHITRTLWEPRLGVAISVLTNAIDGPAEELAVGIAELLMASQRRSAVDLSLTSGFDAPVRGSASVEAARTARRVDLTRFTGRFQSPWMLVDVVLLGEQLYAIPPGAAAPMAAAQRLTVIDDVTLRADEAGGFESGGEPLRFEFDARGNVKRISGAWRLEPASRLEQYSQA